MNTGHTPGDSSVICRKALVLPEWNAGHRPDRFELEITFEPGRCPAFTILPLPAATGI